MILSRETLLILMIIIIAVTILAVGFILSVYIIKDTNDKVDEMDKKMVQAIEDINEHIEISNELHQKHWKAIKTICEDGIERCSIK